MGKARPNTALADRSGARGRHPRATEHRRTQAHDLATSRTDTRHAHSQTHTFTHARTYPPMRCFLSR
eukprot:8668441-Alexandrium_andersonii.AAC.1